MASIIDAQADRDESSPNIAAVTAQPSSDWPPAAGPAPTSALRLLLRGIRRNTAGVVVSFGLLALWQLSEAMVPVVVGVIIDRGIAAGSVTSLVRWGALLLLVFASLIFTYRYGAVGAYRIDQRENHRLRLEIARHVLRPLGARTGVLPGATLSLATADTGAVGGLAQSASYTFASAAAVAVGAVVLLRIDVVIGLVVLLGVPAVLAVIQATTPVISRRSRDQQAGLAQASATAADLVRGLRVIKGIGAEDAAAARYRGLSRSARTASIRLAGSHGVMEGVSTGLSGLFLALVALIAGERALRGTITIGELVAIVGLAQFLAVPIGALGRVGAQLAGAYASGSRIVGFLRTPSLVASGCAEPTHPIAEVSLRDVNTGALHGFSLDSRHGELLCLVVDDPAATGTLVRLLAGEIPADDITGDVRLGGTAITDLSVESRGERLLVTPHHADLLAGTLRSNIDPAGRHSDADLARILHAAAAHDIVQLHEDGLDQPVTPNGATYSGGQRQRIALARALAADRPILVLDDPTTAVDAVTEQQIAAGVRALRHRARNPRTTWIVTTSPALLAQAGRVVMVEGGRAVGEGTHAELVTRREYRELVLR